MEKIFYPTLRSWSWITALCIATSLIFSCHCATAEWLCFRPQQVDSTEVCQISRVSAARGSNKPWWQWNWLRMTSLLLMRFHPIVGPWIWPITMARSAWIMVSFAKRSKMVSELICGIWPWPTQVTLRQNMWAKPFSFLGFPGFFHLFSTPNFPRAKEPKELLDENVIQKTKQKTMVNQEAGFECYLSHFLTFCMPFWFQCYLGSEKVGCGLPKKSQTLAARLWHCHRFITSLSTPLCTWRIVQLLPWMETRLKSKIFGAHRPCSWIFMSQRHLI